MENNIIPNRVSYLDNLRVVSILAVIVIHVVALNFYGLDINSSSWKIFNAYDCLARWCVPVFLMISGALLLQKDLDIKNLFRRILRLVTAFFFWSIAYYIIFNKTEIYFIFTGHFHMWFILMIIGIYLLMPVSRQIAKNDVSTKYYICFGTTFFFILPTIAYLLCDFGTASMKDTWTKVMNILQVMNCQANALLAYLTYFVLGYFLHNTDFSKSFRKVIYVVGALSLISMFVLQLKAVENIHSAIESFYYNYQSLNVLLVAVAVFVFFKYNMTESSNLIVTLSKCSFGAYLVHCVFIEQLNIRLGLSSVSFDPLYSIPFLSILVFALSYGTTLALSKIPYLNKYIM